MGTLVKHPAFALTALMVALTASSCAVGVRQPATDITDTSAVLNGKVLSTTGGPGSWYIEYGPTLARTERTPTRDIDFVVNESEPVSEPIDSLEPGTTYHFAVCAEDSENPGDPFCSPDQTFTTYDPVLGLFEECMFYPPRHYVVLGVSGFPPNTRFSWTVEGGGDPPQAFPIDETTDANGESGGFLARGANEPTEFKATVTWAGSPLETTLFVDCEEPPPST
jgi:hypothetical protein